MALPTQVDEPSAARAVANLTLTLDRVLPDDDVVPDVPDVEAELTEPAWAWRACWTTRWTR